MKTVVRRVARLEDRLWSVRNSQPRFRIVVRRLDREPGLEQATCRRTLWPNGTLFESVYLGASGSDGFTDEEFERWIESFPIGAV